jgi:hypothetical protein
MIAQYERYIVIHLDTPIDNKYNGTHLGHDTVERRQQCFRALLPLL